MINQLAAILIEAMKDESNMIEADKLYSERFKTTETFTVKSGEFHRSELIEFLMMDVYAKQEPDYPDYMIDAEEGEEDYEYDDNHDRYDDYIDEPVLKGLSFEEADAVVDHLEFVILVNYKGEEEGMATTLRAKNLRTFHGKYNYE